MRLPIIAGNWKMNTTVEEARHLVAEMCPRLDKVEGVEKVLCPPFVSLWAVKELIRNSSVKLGAQNMYFAPQGAYTGEVSSLMLAGWCEYVILGHSERRQYFGESNEMVRQKIKAALEAGLKPILCVGERLEENERGKTEEVIELQLKEALRDILGGSSSPIVVAYEPVWAIGTGKAATGKQANETIGFIRQVISRLCGKESAQTWRIQYGGSVTAANIAEFVAQPEIDGALVGGASIKATEFLSIVEQTAAVEKRR